MTNKIALSAVGRDRPGIVAAVSQVLYEQGCNIEDSSMTILHGEFAMILISTLPDQLEFAQLERSLHQAEQLRSLSISVKQLAPEEVQVLPPAGSSESIVSVYGADHPGIVYRVADKLAELQVNITDVNTKVVGGASPIYIMILEVTTPPSLLEESLQQHLQTLARELTVDITVQTLQTADL